MNALKNSNEKTKIARPWKANTENKRTQAQKRRCGKEQTHTGAEKKNPENLRERGTRKRSSGLDRWTAESQKKQRAEPTRQLNGEGERERRTSQQANVRAKKGRESDWNPNEIYGVPLES